MPEEYHNQGKELLEQAIHDGRLASKKQLSGLEDLGVFSAVIDLNGQLRVYKLRDVKANIAEYGKLLVLMQNPHEGDISQWFIDYAKANNIVVKKNYAKGHNPLDYTQYTFYATREAAEMLDSYKELSIRE